MKTLVLLFSMIFSAGAGAEAGGGLRFFYCIHAEHSCDDTAADVAVKSGNASLMARKAFSHKDDFVGFRDAHDTVLQFYVEGTDSILVDMPIPELKGSYGTHMKRTQALRLIAHLSPPLSRYRSDLKLEFAKW